MRLDTTPNNTPGRVRSRHVFNTPTSPSDTLKGTSNDNSSPSDDDSTSYPEAFVTEQYYDSASEGSEGHENSPDSSQQAYELSTLVDQHCLARALENIKIDLENFTSSHPTVPRRSGRTVRRPYSFDEARRRGKLKSGCATNKHQAKLQLDSLFCLFQILSKMYANPIS